MFVLSSSSFRIVISKDPDKQLVGDDSIDRLFNLDHLDIPDTTSVQFLGFLDEIEVDNLRDFIPLSPRTISHRDEIVQRALSKGKEEFKDKPKVSYTSIYSTQPISVEGLGNWVDFRNGWKCVVPKPSEPIWMMPEYGMHGSY